LIVAGDEIMDFNLLHRIPLFEGIETKDLKSLLSCLGAMYRSYEKNETVMLAGSRIDQIGIVLDGKVQVVREDLLGNRSIIESIEEYELFAEEFACASVDVVPISVIAAEDCTIMWVRFRKILTTCSSACIFHSRLIENMMKILARKNLTLNQKIDCLSKRSIRDKIIAYLVSQAEKHKNLTFTIPFNRTELADYLCIDRSAMSRELGKMRAEGLCDYDRNTFRILSKEAFIV
jgi:CRP-like cAMP-binding protein